MPARARSTGERVCLTRAAGRRSEPAGRERTIASPTGAPPASIEVSAAARAGLIGHAVAEPMAGKSEHTVIEVCGRELRVSNPGKLFFPAHALTKLDLVEY